MEIKDKIIIISPYPEETKNLRKLLIKSKRENFEIYTAVLDEGLRLAKKLNQQEVGVIISSGVTKELIQREIDIPVIKIDLTILDIMDSLKEAKKISNKIAFFCDSISDSYNFDKVKNILDLEELDIYYYRDENDIDIQVKQAAEAGIQVIVASGSCILKRAELYGMFTIKVSTSTDSLWKAIIRAEEVLRIRYSDRQSNDTLQMVIDSSYGCIIALNSMGIITHFNPAARDALKISLEKILNNNIKDFLEFDSIKKVYGSGQPTLGDVQEINGANYIISRFKVNKELENLSMIITFQEVDNVHHLDSKIRKKLYANGYSAKYDFADIVCCSKKMHNIISITKKFSKTEGTVLITGESGTGKELFAQSIAQNSLRSGEPFVAINCAAIQQSLLQSELFGYEDGAFSGAKKGGNPGLFEAAHRGTIFLDEISEMPLDLQANLLRVIQEKIVRRVGGQSFTHVDVRIIVATNRDLRNLVSEGYFREDLYYRLNVLNVNIPPLRERREDIPLLIKYFINSLLTGKDARYAIGLTNPYLAKLMEYSWPGNVRELQNFIQKYVLLTNSLTSEDIVEDLVNELFFYEAKLNQKNNNSISVQLGTMEQMQLEIINKLLEQSTMNKEDLANMLGISRTTLWKKLNQA